jgi:hypothetical protein
MAISDGTATLNSPPIKRLAQHPNRFRWSKDLSDLLGQVADEVLARLAGVHSQTVTQERRRRGIPPYKPRRGSIVWNDEMIALLGTNSDRVIAGVLGIDHRSVFRKRRLLGIAPYAEPLQKEKPGFDWTRAAVALLGTQSDRKLAKRLGLSAASVHNKRLELHIASHRPPQKRIEWTAEMISLLGAISDLKFAQRFAITKDSVKSKRDALGIPPHHYKSQAIARTTSLAKILRLPNRELRTRYGITKGTALKLRHEFGVPIPDSRNQRWTPARLKRLGRVPDAKLAQTMGLTPGAVGYKRRTLGIPPCITKKPLV